jgi:hypothetical protein
MKEKTACKHRHDRSRGPRQDDAYRRAITKVLHERLGTGEYVAFENIDKAPKEREKGHHDCDGARGVPKPKSATTRTWTARDTRTTSRT